MKNKYKKGDVVTIEYAKNDAVYTTYGIVLSISDSSIKVGHNFFGFNPIDATRIPRKSIQKIAQTIPIE